MLGEYHGRDRLQALPNDIKRMIVACLDEDQDYHSIAYLMMSCKSWFDHLAYDEEAWQLRYESIAPECEAVLSSNSPVWRIAVCRVLPRICAGCHTQNADKAIVWPRYPHWARVCAGCTYRHPYFFCVNYESKRSALVKLESQIGLRLSYGPAVLLLAK